MGAVRVSTRLLSNAGSTYLRLGTTFVLGLFTTWYILGAIGVVGFGLIALAASSTGPSHALERAFRFGLVRELAAAIASGDAGAIRRSVDAAFRLCLQVTGPLAGLVLLLAAAAWGGLFNTPNGQPELKLAFAILVLAEGVHAAARLLSAPYLQSLFAAQHVALDNLLMVVSRATYALSAVAVFGWILPDASLDVQLSGFAVSRATLQLGDVALGIWLAKRRLPALRLERSANHAREYHAVRSTVWHSSQVAILMNINPQFLAVLINLFFGLPYNAIWQIALQFSGFARMFSEGLLRGIGPLATHLQEGGRRRAAVDLMVRSIRFQLGIALPTAILLGTWAGPLLELWVGRRLAANPDLPAAGIPVPEALSVATAMATILLAFQTLRAGFFGVENVLYGLGKVHSYAWFSKWTTLIAVGSAAVLMAWFRDPLAAPFALLLAYAFYSPGVLLAAARRETGLPVAHTLRRSLPRPLAVNAVFLALMASTRLLLGRLTLAKFAGVLIGASTAYGALALIFILEADERRRLVQVVQQGMRWLARRSAGGAGGAPMA